MRQPARFPDLNPGDVIRMDGKLYSVVYTFLPYKAKRPKAQCIELGYQDSTGYTFDAFTAEKSKVNL